VFDLLNENKNGQVNEGSVTGWKWKKELKKY
jgi:hypothetical protein